MKLRHGITIILAILNSGISCGLPEHVAPQEAVIASDQLRAKLRAGDFGFTKILVTQRNQLNPSHVYTYHEESLKPGGGLWIADFSGQKPGMARRSCSAGNAP